MPTRNEVTREALLAVDFAQNRLALGFREAIKGLTRQTLGSRLFNNKTRNQVFAHTNSTRIHLNISLVAQLL